MGGVSAKDGRFIYQTKQKYFDRFDTIKFLRKLRRQSGWRKLAIFWDNCAIHKAEEVKEELKKLRIKVIHNVPYKPEYNGIELVWAKLKHNYRKEKLRR